MLRSIDKIKRKLIEQGKVISFYISNHVQNHLEFEQRQIEWNLSRRWVPEGGLSVSLCAASIIQRSKTINVCLRDKILIILNSRPLLLRSLLARSFVSHKQIVSQLRVTCQIVSQSLFCPPAGQIPRQCARVPYFTPPSFFLITQSGSVTGFTRIGPLLSRGIQYSIHYSDTFPDRYKSYSSLKMIYCSPVADKKLFNSLGKS